MYKYHNVDSDVIKDNSTQGYLKSYILWNIGNLAVRNEFIFHTSHCIDDVGQILVDTRTLT